MVEPVATVQAVALAGLARGMVDLAAKMLDAIPPGRATGILVETLTARIADRSSILQASLSLASLLTTRSLSLLFYMTLHRCLSVYRI
jgi:hypothetical protein